MTENNEEKGINFFERLAELQAHRSSLQHRVVVANRFSQNAMKEIAELDEEINLIRGFIGEDEIYTLKPLQDNIEDLGVTRLNLHPGRADKVRRGALSVKEKEKMAEERSEEAKKKEEERAPNDKTRPQRPKQPGEKTEPEQPIKTPEERKADIVDKLKQKDPRKQKEALEELKKPENKGLGQDDEEFQKLVKDSGKRVEKFDKIRESLRKNLRELMQSDSEEVKKSLSDLRAGKVGSGITKFKEIARSNDTRFNPVAKAAKGVCENVEELYREFDIKPEESLSRATLNEAKPVFTRQTGTKSGYDIDIDSKSKTGGFMGQSKQLSREEIEAYDQTKKRIKDVYNIDVDKLPPADAATRESANLVHSIIQEDALHPHGKMQASTIIMADRNGGR